MADRMTRMMLVVLGLLCLSACAAAPGCDDKPALWPDGNAIITGSISADGNWNYVTIKIGSEGEVRWLAEYDGRSQGIDRALALALDAQGNAFVSGVADMTEDSECVACPSFTTIKYAADTGETLWESRYEGPRPGANRAADLAVSGSHLIVGGMSAGLNTARGQIGASPRDFAILKYDGVAD